ncbi:MAG: hypothetical protein KDA61_04315, partial [Planctomycetales bacterium]|nr:hypothetical protein [Planctomycetales bacterium]
HVGELFTGFGRVDASAETVAGEAVKQARDYLASGAPVGRFLADQLFLLLGVAALRCGAPSCFRTLPLSRHSATQIEVLRQFGCTEIEIENEQSTQLVRIGK